MGILSEQEPSLIQDLTATPLPKHIHRSRVYKGEQTPCVCPKCGRTPDDATPPMLVDDTIILCGWCGPVMPEDETLITRTDQDRLRQEVLECWDSEVGRKLSGKNRGSSGRTTPKKTPKYRVERRYEQEPMSGAPAPKEKVSVVRAERGTETVILHLDSTVAEALRKEANWRTFERGETVSMVSVIIEALPRLHRLTASPPSMQRGTLRDTVTVKFSKNEKLLLAMASERFERSMGELVQHLLEPLLESWTRRAAAEDSDSDS